MKIVLPLLFSLTTLTAAAGDQGSRTPPKPPHELSVEMKAAFENCKEHGKPGESEFDNACQIWDLSGRTARYRQVGRRGRMRPSKLVRARRLGWARTAHTRCSVPSVASKVVMPAALPA